MIPQRFAVALLVVLLASMARGGLDKETKPALLVPTPELSPERVVEIQVQALQKNDTPAIDAGIATTFRFASPSNRKVTGPLERFTMIVKSPGYKPMIGHRIAGYGPMKVVGNLAGCRVTIVDSDGKAHEYEFRLSKDPESGCWYTDGCLVIPDKPAIDEGKIA